MGAAADDGDRAERELEPAAGPEAAASPAATATPSAGERVPRVLVLDNDRQMRELLGFALRRRGLEVLACAGVEEAEAALAEADALLLDFHLGEGHSGAELARRWSSESRLPSLWLVTGMPEDPEVRALEQLPELVEVVGKPFSVIGLAEGVEDTLRRLAPSRGGPEKASPCPDGHYGELPSPGPAGSHAEDPEPAPKALLAPSWPEMGDLGSGEDLHGMGPVSG